jgi:hypothetical protein
MAGDGLGRLVDPLHGQVHGHNCLVCLTMEELHTASTIGAAPDPEDVSATVTLRAVARLVDVVVITAVVSVLYADVVHRLIDDGPDNVVDAGRRLGWTMRVTAVVVLAIGEALPLWIGRRSFGKWVVGLDVTWTERRRPWVRTALMPGVVLVPWVGPALLLAAVLPCLWHRRAWQDRVARSRVVVR